MSECQFRVGSVESARQCCQRSCSVVHKSGIWDPEMQTSSNCSQKILIDFRTSLKCKYKMVQPRKNYFDCEVIETGSRQWSQSIVFFVSSRKNWRWRSWVTPWCGVWLNPLMTYSHICRWRSRFRNIFPETQTHTHTEGRSIPLTTNHVHRRDLKVSEPYLRPFGRSHGPITSTDVISDGR